MAPGLGAPVKGLQEGGRAKAVAAVVCVAVACVLAVAPNGFSFSTGASSDTVQDPNFAQFGCAACHGPANAFRPLDNSAVRFAVQDADGGHLNGPYAPEGTYTISIHLDEQVAPDGGTVGNHAGFNLRASAGSLAGVDGQSQATTDGLQATHINGRLTAWNVTWTAPAEGAVVFHLFVNDVDGSGANDLPDNVHQLIFAFPDEAGAQVGGVEEHEVHFGISLQQYWIGLIGLFGMVLIMVAGFVYLKFVNPHNTDQKDR